MISKHKLFNLDELLPEIWRLHKQGLSSYKITQELLNPPTLQSLIRKRLKKHERLEKDKGEPIRYTHIDSKFLNFDYLDMNILRLKKQGLNATQIVERIFKPASFHRWIRHKIAYLKKIEKLK